VSGRMLTVTAALVIFAGAGLAAGLMFPGHESGARVAVFAGLAVALSGSMFARTRRRKEDRR